MTDLPTFEADLSWASRGDCNGHPHPEWWWPVDDTNGTGCDLARKVCASCPVLKQCQTHGIKHERHGMWGGLTAKQRQEIRRGHPIPALEAPPRPGRKVRWGRRPAVAPDRVEQIRAADGNARIIAERFGVSRSTVVNIKAGNGAYAHPPENVKSTPDSTGATGLHGCSLGAQKSAPGDASTPPELDTPTEEARQ